MKENSKKAAYLASPLSDRVVENVKKAAMALRTDPSSKKTGQLAVESIHDMTKESLEFYFFTPMHEMNIGFISQNIVKMGVNAGLGVLNTFGSRLVSSLNTHQKVTLADYLEQAIVYTDKPGSPGD